MIIYFFDTKTRAFHHTELIEDKQTLPDNATKIKPIAEDGGTLLDPTFDGEKWVGITQEEYDAKHPAGQVPEGYKPDEEEKTLKELQVQQAQLALQQVEFINNQRVINAQLMLNMIRGE